MLRSILDDWFVESAGALTYPALCPSQESCCLPWVPLWLTRSHQLTSESAAKGRSTLTPGGPAQTPEEGTWDTPGLSLPSWVLRRFKHTSVTAKDHMGTGRDTRMLHSAVTATTTFDSWQQIPSGPAVRETKALASLLPLGRSLPLPAGWSIF